MPHCLSTHVAIPIFASSCMSSQSPPPSSNCMLHCIMFGTIMFIFIVHGLQFFVLLGVSFSFPIYMSIFWQLMFCQHQFKTVSVLFLHSVGLMRDIYYFGSNQPMPGYIIVSSGHCLNYL